MELGFFANFGRFNTSRMKSAQDKPNNKENRSVIAYGLNMNTGYVDSTQKSNICRIFNDINLKIRKGMIIDLYLNLTTRTLGYAVDNHYVADAVKNIEQGIYRMAVTIPSNGTAIKVMDHDYIFET